MGEFSRPIMDIYKLPAEAEAPAAREQRIRYTWESPELFPAGEYPCLDEMSNDIRKFSALPEGKERKGREDTLSQEISEKMVCSPHHIKEYLHELDSVYLKLSNEDGNRPVLGRYRYFFEDALHKVTKERVSPVFEDKEMEGWLDLSADRKYETIADNIIGLKITAATDEKQFIENLYDLAYQALAMNNPELVKRLSG